jgi:hypothetical protein
MGTQRDGQATIGVVTLACKEVARLQRHTTRGHTEAFGIHSHGCFQVGQRGGWNITKRRRWQRLKLPRFRQVIMADQGLGQGPRGNRGHIACAGELAGVHHPAAAVAGARTRTTDDHHSHHRHPSRHTTPHHQVLFWHAAGYTF